MKRPLAIPFLILVVSSVHGQLTLGHPDFDSFANAVGDGGTAYTVGGNLAGQTNGQGLPWFAAGSGSAQPVISAGALSIPGLLPDSGNSITISATSGTSARLDLGTNSASSTFSGTNPLTLYYSMALKVTALGGLTTSGAFFAGFNNSTGSQTNTPMVFGARLYARLAGAGYNLGINKSDGTAADISWESDTYNVGDTNFVVACYTFSGTPGSGNDSVSLGVNPDPSTFGAASAPSADRATSAGGNIVSGASEQIASFMLRQSSTVEPGTTIIDELSVGLSWADVTPTARFSNLTANSSAASGTTNLTLGGKMSGPGPIYPALGETITVTINGNAQTTVINDSTGGFSLSYNPSSLAVSTNAYPITYTYAGDASLNAVTNTSTTLTITNPNLPFSITSEYLDDTGTKLVMVWQSVPGVVYQVEVSSNLLTWTNAGSAITATAAAVTNTIAIGNFPAQAFFAISYRVP